jgi:RNA polymerase sigma factor (sigma-70 family)
MSPFISLRFLQSQTDARLLTLAAEGHERAFEALVRRHRRALLAYGRRLLGSSSRAEDAVQQALLQAWIALQHGTEVSDAKSWFYRIVRNAALNMQRGAAGQEFAELSNASKADGAGDIDGWMDIRDVFTELAALPPLQRQALLRTSLDGESHDEVASALGVTTKAVRGLVYRARATMRAAVSALIPPPLVHWALSGKSGVGGSDRIAELVAGGSGIGVGAIALNSGAAMVTVGALAAGVAVAPHGHQARPQRHSHTQVAATAATASGAGPAAGSGTIVLTGAADAGHAASALGGRVDVAKSAVGTPGGGGSSGSGGQGSGGRGGPGGGSSFGSGSGSGRHDGSGSGTGDGSGSLTGSPSGSGDGSRSGSGSGHGDGRPGSGGGDSSGSGSDVHGSIPGGFGGTVGHDGSSGSGDGGSGSGSPGGGGDGGGSGSTGSSDGGGGTVTPAVAAGTKGDGSTVQGD